MDLYTLKETVSERPWLFSVAAIGAIFLIRLVDSIIDFLQFHFTPTRNPLAAYKRDGKTAYALITGASAGIGFGVAQALVKQGFGVILLGHLEDELTEAASKLRHLSGPDGAAAAKEAHVQTIVMDARTATAAEMQNAVQTRIVEAGLAVSILVNNVGSNPIALPAFRALGTYSAVDVDAVVNMNARFMARLTALVLPVLSRNWRMTGEDGHVFALGTHQRSLVLNMSSRTMLGAPWLAIYSATKAFNWSLSVALARELAADAETRHVDCLAVVPGDVVSQGNSVLEGIPWGSPDSDTFGRCIVERTDGALRRGMREMRPFWLHDLQHRAWNVLGEGRRTKEMISLLTKKRDAFNAVFKKDE